MAGAAPSTALNAEADIPDDVLSPMELLKQTEGFPKNGVLNQAYTNGGRSTWAGMKKLLTKLGK